MTAESTNSRSVTTARAMMAVSLAAICSCYSPNQPITGESGGSGPTSTAPDSTAALTESATEGVSTATSSDTAADVTTGVSASTGQEGFCGDGRVAADEVCDDGVNDGSYGGCMPGCSELADFCGDGVIQEREVCDDENDIDADGCNANCIPSGQVLWTESFNGGISGPDAALGVAIDTLGAIVVVGREGLDDAGTDTLAWTNRYTSAGELEWQATYSGPTNDRGVASGVAFDPNGRAYVVGYYRAASSYNLWARTYEDLAELGYTHIFGEGASNDERGHAIAVNEDGRAVIAGFEVRDDLGQQQDLWLRRLDSDGTEMWTRSFHGVGNDVAHGVAVGPEGEVVVAGAVDDADSSNIWVRKYSQEGSEEWTRSFDSGGIDAAYGVAVDESGRVAVTGTALGDIWFRVYDSAGEE